MAMAALRGASRFLFSKTKPRKSTSALAPPPLPPLLLPCRGITHKLFVGGLSFFTTEDGLAEAFSQYGQVIEAIVVMDMVSNKSKGFGFVKFASEDEARKARTEMNGKVLNGRVIYVDIAKEKPQFHEDAIPIARGPPEPIGNN